MIVDVKTELVEPNKIQVTTVEEKDRYVGKVVYDQVYCEQEFEDFKENNKCWTTKHSREGFDCMDTGENWEPQRDNILEDLTHFQLYLDKTYGKERYEAFALGAYVHSGVSFSLSKGSDNRDRWDSGTIGFVGIPKYSVEYWEKRGGICEYASLLTAAWEGTLGEICVYDDYNGDLIDSCWTTDTCNEIEEWKAKMKEEYGVTEYEEENHY